MALRNWRVLRGPRPHGARRHTLGPPRAAPLSPARFPPPRSASAYLSVRLALGKMSRREILPESLRCGFVEGVATPRGAGVPTEPVSQGFGCNWLRTSTCRRLLGAPRPCTRGVGRCVPGGSLSLSLLAPMTDPNTVGTFLNRAPEADGTSSGQPRGPVLPLFWPSARPRDGPRRATGDSPGRRWSMLLWKSLPGGSSLPRTRRARNHKFQSQWELAQVRENTVSLAFWSKHSAFDHKWNSGWMQPFENVLGTPACKRCQDEPQSLKSRLTSSEWNTRKLPHPRKPSCQVACPSRPQKGLVEQKVHSHHRTHRA